jgi:hypothetical protein
MFSFIKKLLGLPTEEEKRLAEEAKSAVPYKVEAPVTPVINNKSGDTVDVPKVIVQPLVTEEVVVKFVEPVKKEEPVIVELPKEVEVPTLKEEVKAKPKTKKVKKEVVEKTVAEKEKGVEKSTPKVAKKSRSKKS